MTIPSDHIKFSDDGTTAWLVVSADPAEYGWDVALDRPCSTCDEYGEVWRNEMGNVIASPCPDCRSGRHCFEIEVDTNVGWRGIEDGPPNPPDVLTVSVVPGMVVEIRPFLMLVGRQIVPDCASTDPNTWLYYPATDERPLATDTPSGLQFTDNCDQIALPSAAAPGMWVVKLEVHR